MSMIKHLKETTTQLFNSSVENSPRSNFDLCGSIARGTSQDSSAEDVVRDVDNYRRLSELHIKWLHYP